MNSKTRKHKFALLLFFLLFLQNFKKSCGDYWHDRNSILLRESEKLLPYRLILNDKEQFANTKLMEWKRKEFDDGMKNPKEFLHSKSGIENSQIFQFIKGLPKGASLHSHSSAMVSFDFYIENVNACLKPNKQLELFDSNEYLDKKKCTRMLEKDLLASQLTLFNNDFWLHNLDFDAIKERSKKIYSTMKRLVLRKNVFGTYIRRVMQDFYDDNITYIEYAGCLDPVFDEKGEEYSSYTIIKKEISEFQKTHPDFLGLRVVYSRCSSNENFTTEEYLKKALELQNLYPDFVVGVDLNTKEQLLVDSIYHFLEAKNSTQFFYRSETWLSPDQNYIDAILLNSTRIRFNPAILKHPEILKLIKSRDIGIEISPISDQVFNNVINLQNHPANFLLANGYPVVITCDSPILWAAKGVSYDWYLMFMGMARKDADLKFLKNLAMNSFYYSGMDVEDKLTAIMKWEERWNKYIENFFEENKG